MVARDNIQKDHRFIATGIVEVEVREIIFTQGKIKQAEASPTLDSTPEVDADAAPSDL